jgi:hypothetical protein
MVGGDRQSLWDDIWYNDGKDLWSDGELDLMSSAVQNTPTAEGDGFPQPFANRLAGVWITLLNDPSDIFLKDKVDVIPFIISFNKVSGFRVPVPSCRSSNGSRKPM